MKKLLLKVIFFIILFFILDYILYSGLFIFFNKPRFEQYLDKNTEVVFFGDSRFLSGINPRVIKELYNIYGYNMAPQGSSIISARGMEAVVMHHYLPKIAVLEVMNLDHERSARQNLAPYYYLPEIRKLLQIYPYHVRLTYEYIKSSRYNSLILHIIRDNLIKADKGNMGYKPLYGSVKSLAALALTKQSLIKNGVAILTEFIEQARMNNVGVVFVEMPTLRGDRSQSHDDYVAAALKYDIPFLDYSKEGKDFFALPQSCFYDATHLNDRGAAIFSVILGEKLVQLIPKKD